MKRLWWVMTVWFLSVVPTISSAAGLVPCGGTGQQPCQTCHVVQLVNNVIGWLVAILGTIAAIIIVYAGFRLVTSAGNASAKGQAKELIQNMFIGYAIVLGGWLMIDTGMKMLLADGSTQLGVWNAVQCTAQPVTEANRFEVGTFEPIVAEPVNEGINTGARQWLDCTALPNGSYNCNAQQAQCERSGGSPTIDSSSGRAVICMYSGAGSISGGGGNDTLVGGGSGGTLPPDLSAAGACNASVIGRHFPSQLIGSAQCIIRAESSCGGRMVSRSDVMRIDGRAFSFGPMQINLTVHELRGCSGYPAVLDCKSAFSGRNYSARVVNESLYQQCARAAQNVDCNIKNGYRIYREAGNRWRPWSTAAACRLR